MMKSISRTPFYIALGALLWAILPGPSVALGQDGGYKVHVPEGVYIELTKDFYQALRDEGAGGSKVYSNDPSSEYLREISISTRFMVETNLQILKNQERIIQMLQSGPEKKKK